MKPFDVLLNEVIDIAANWISDPSKRWHSTQTALRLVDGSERHLLHSTLVCWFPLYPSGSNLFDVEPKGAAICFERISLLKAGETGPLETPTCMVNDHYIIHATVCLCVERSKVLKSWLWVPSDCAKDEAFTDIQRQ